MTILPHAIHSFEFIDWRGETPQFTRQVLEQFSVPGLPNVGYLGMGYQAPEFTAECEFRFGSIYDAKQNFNQMRLLCNLGPVQVQYAWVNYFTNFQILFKVIDVREVESRTMVRAVGPTYDFFPAIKQRLAVTMRGHGL